jgi:cardiolipin synthase
VNTAGQSLVEQVQQAAIDLPAGHVNTLASHLDGVEAPTAQSRHTAANLIPAPRFKAAVSSLWSAWESAGGIDGPALAMMLRAASAVANTLRASQSIDIAWTGPSSAHVPVRLSGQVLLDLIAEARQQLIIVSFAAYKVPEIVDALRAAALRGVDVRLILETAEDSGGALRQDAADAFDKLRHVVSFWVWPKANRPEGKVSMHVKAAIVDGRVALVTSANLTGAALEKNMELGLVVRGGAAPRRLADHFQALAANGVIKQVQPT